VVETERHLIGVESKRFEPFRDAKSAKLSDAYDRDVWGNDMKSYCGMRDAVRSKAVAFKHLDAAQLIKHAYGLVTQGPKIGKEPVLLYLFAEPEFRGPATITRDDYARHRAEIDQFSSEVRGNEVRFASCSYREWLESWSGDVAAHARAITDWFHP